MSNQPPESTDPTETNSSLTDSNVLTGKVGLPIVGGDRTWENQTQDGEVKCFFVPEEFFFFSAWPLAS